MAKIDVLTNRYGPSRVGANTAETVLNQQNVNVNTFGKIFSRGVDGQIYAQPLIVSDLPFVAGTTRSVVIVVTTRNMAYAFDAEDPSQCHPVWRTPLDSGGDTPVPRSDYGPHYIDFTAEIGVTSTPVVDRPAGIVYLTSKSRRAVNGKRHYFCRLHALDLKTGVQRLNGPAIIAETIVNDANNTSFTFVSGPSVSGTGTGSQNGVVRFNAFLQLQRPGLLLQDGILYLAFASQGDQGSYHGWILAYEAATLKLITNYCTTPNWGEGGIWQSGCGLAGDDTGNIYAVCGNGKSNAGGCGKTSNLDPTPGQLAGGPFWGHSVIKLNLDKQHGRFVLQDWYTPFDILERNACDDDMCAGPVLLPWKNLVGAWGKDKAYHIMDRATLGKFNSGRNAIAQFAPNMTMPENGGGTGHIHCAPVFFDDPNVGPVSYVWGENDMLRGYRFDPQTSQFETHVQPNLQSQQVLPVGMPGGMLSVSSNGSGPSAVKGSAIVWVCHPTEGNANIGTVAGILLAFRADDLRQPIWASNHDPRGSDDLGEFAKFCPPVVANGRVYVATFSQQLVVYGLLSEGLGDPLGKWQQADIPVRANGGNVFRVEGTATFSCNRFTILGSGHDIWDPFDAFHFVCQPVVSPEVTISARVVSVQETSDWAKAGVMIRETLDADSAHAMMVITPGHGAAFQFRPSKGAPSVNVSFNQPITAPFWVRLTRTSAQNTVRFTGFVSRDGQNWVEVGTANFAMATNAFAGMPVTAHTDGGNNPLLQDLCVAVIDKVNLS